MKKSEPRHLVVIPFVGAAMLIGWVLLFYHSEPDMTVSATEIVAIENEVSNEQLTTSRNLRLVSLLKDTQTVYFENGDTVESIMLSRSLLSPKIEYQGPSELVLYSTVFPQDENPEFSQTPLAKVNLHKNHDSQIVILMPTKVTSHQYQTTVILDVKPGSVSLINVTQNDLAVKTGDRKLFLKSNRQTTFKSDAQSGAYQKWDIYSLIKNDKPVRCFAGKIAIVEDKRNFYIITPNDSSQLGKIKIIRISDSQSG